MIITLPKTNREWEIFHRKFHNDTYLVPDLDFYNKFKKNGPVMRKQLVVEAIKNDRSRK